MKTLLVVLGMGLSIAQANAQKVNVKDVPLSIKHSLHQNYGIKDADWDKEGNNYEASFEQKGKEVSVVFDASGSILETEREIGKAELPVAVMDVLKKDYPDFELEESAKIDSKGVITYEAEVEKGEQTFDLIFSAQGKLIKKEVKEEGK